MKKSTLWLLTTIVSFYSNISSSATTEWLKANLTSDVGSRAGEKYIFSFSPQSRSMEWGIYNDCSARYLGYFIMIRETANSSDGPWEFFDNAYINAIKYNAESPPEICNRNLPTFPMAVKTLKNRTSVSSSMNHGSITSYCVGFGYSSYTSQSSSTRDGRPKRADGTDINYNDADLSCGRYIPHYIPCRATAASGSLNLEFKNVNLTSLNEAKATTSMGLKCVHVAGLIIGNTNENAFRIKLNKGNGIALSNGTEASIYIGDQKITSANNNAENFILKNATVLHNLTVSATLSGTPTKMGNFEGSGYLVMEYF